MRNLRVLWTILLILLAVSHAHALETCGKEIFDEFALVTAAAGYAFAVDGDVELPIDLEAIYKNLVAPKATTDDLFGNVAVTSKIYGGYAESIFFLLRSRNESDGTSYLARLKIPELQAESTKLSPAITLPSTDVDGVEESILINNTFYFNTSTVKFDAETGIFAKIDEKLESNASLNAYKRDIHVVREDCTDAYFPDHEVPGRGDELIKVGASATICFNVVNPKSNESCRLAFGEDFLFTDVLLVRLNSNARQNLVPCDESTMDLEKFHFFEILNEGGCIAHHESFSEAQKGANASACGASTLGRPLTRAKIGFIDEKTVVIVMRHHEAETTKSRCIVKELADFINFEETGDDAEIDVEFPRGDLFNHNGSFFFGTKRYHKLAIVDGKCVITSEIPPDEVKNKIDLQNEIPWHFNGVLNDYDALVGLQTVVSYNFVNLSNAEIFHPYHCAPRTVNTSGFVLVYNSTRWEEDAAARDNQIKSEIEKKKLELADAPKRNKMLLNAVAILTGVFTVIGFAATTVCCVKSRKIKREKNAAALQADYLKLASGG